MHSPSAKLTLISLLAVSLASCSSLISYKSGDALKNIYATRVALVRQKYADPQTFEAAVTAAKADPSGRARNDLLNDFIFLIDTNYSFWEKATFNKKAFGDFSTDFAAASLSTASGIVTGGGVQGAKSILSFIAAGITSTKGSFNSDVLQNQNLLAILSKTRSLRSQKLVPLQAGMYQNHTTTANPLSQYSIEQGMIDLAAYYEAGTFTAALQDIIDTAGAAKTQSDNQVSVLKGNPTPAPAPH